MFGAVCDQYGWGVHLLILLTVIRNRFDLVSADYAALAMLVFIIILPRSALSLSGLLNTGLWMKLN